MFLFSCPVRVLVIGYDNIEKENLIYINKTIKDLITSKNKKAFLTVNMEIFMIYSLPKNPKNGGSPPNDNKTKILVNLS